METSLLVAWKLCGRVSEEVTLYKNAWFLFLKIFLLFITIFTLNVLLYFYFICFGVLPTCVSLRGCQILELETVVSCHVGAGN